MKAILCCLSVVAFVAVVPAQENPLAKMENAYQSKLTKADKGQKIMEAWTVAEFGFKNWKEE